MNISKEPELRNIFLYMPDGGERGVIQMWFSHDVYWCEFRGKSYSAWGKNESTQFSRLHDKLDGWAAAWLHADQVVLISPKLSHHKRNYKICSKELHNSYF